MPSYLVIVTFGLLKMYRFYGPDVYSTYNKLVRQNCKIKQNGSHEIEKILI